MASLNIRIDDDVKSEAEKIFNSLGLSMAAAISIYLRTVIRENGIPFELSMPPEMVLRKENRGMPTISMFRGIKVYINWADHMPPHFHAKYGGDEVIVSINELEVIEGDMPNKQLKMLLGWAAFHQEELVENWELARKKQDLFAIEPLR